MICFSESYPDSSVSSDNGNIYIKDYKLVRADFKKYLPVIV